MTPELAALFALLKEIDPLAAEVPVALLHLEENRALAGVFDQGSLISQREYYGALREARAALEWIRGDYPALSLAYISSSQVGESHLALLRRGALRFVHWNPCDAVGMRQSLGVSEDASLAIPTALAFCALEPDTPTRINFVRGEHAAAERSRRRSRCLRLAARTATVASVALSALLFFDSSSQRSARAALTELEAATAKERIERRWVEQVHITEQEVLREIEAMGLLPLYAGESLKALVAALPSGLTVSAIYLDSSTVRMRGSSKVASRVSEVAEAVSQLVPGAAVEVSENGEFTLQAGRAPERENE